MIPTIPELDQAAKMAEAIIAGRHFSKQLEGVPAIAIDDAVKLAEAYLAALEGYQAYTGHVTKIEHGAIRLLNAMEKMGNRVWLSLNVREAESALRCEVFEAGPAR